MRNNWRHIAFLVAILFCACYTTTAQIVTSHLPVIVINTHGGEIEDEPKIAADLQIMWDTISGVNSSDGPFNVYNGKVGIETRGNSSLGFDKKTYTMQLWDAGTNPLPTELLGMSADADWILHGMYIDKSLVRIPMSFDLFREMGNYASNWRYVEVVLNGEYIGLYALVERIKRAPGRVNVDSLGNTDDTGGYILRIDWDEGRPEFTSEYESMGGVSMVFQYFDPKGSQLDGVQKDYIKAYMERFENALFAQNFTNDQGEHYTQLADVESFIDFLLINELSKNSDGYKLSTYLHKDSEAFDGRLKMGPIWDFDQTYGLSLVCSNEDPCGWTFLQTQDGCEDLNTMPLWWETITADKTFSDLLTQRWFEYRSGFLDIDSLYSRIDQYVTNLDGVQQRNFGKWNILTESVWIEPEEPVLTTYEDQINYIKDWLRLRIEWMDRNIGSIYDMVSQKGELKLWPNPAVDRTSIAAIPGSSIRITDLYGRVVWEVSNCTESAYTIDVSQWAIGTYVVFVQTNRGVYSGKMLVGG